MNQVDVIKKLEKKIDILKLQMNEFFNDLGDLFKEIKSKDNNFMEEEDEKQKKLI